MAFHIVDGIVGMEGNGPTAGTPREIGVLISGTNPYDIDLLCGRIIGLEQGDVLTMSQAFIRKLGKESADEVEVVYNGITQKATKENLVDIIIEDYELLDNKSDLQFGGSSLFGRIRGKLIGTFLASKPSVCELECIGCRKCEQICPAKAITMQQGKQTQGNIPCIDRKKCIKCFCCQEFCPKGAMKVKRTVVAKLLAH